MAVSTDESRFVIGASDWHRPITARSSYNLIHWTDTCPSIDTVRASNGHRTTIVRCLPKTDRFTIVNFPSFENTFRPCTVRELVGGLRCRSETTPTYNFFHRKSSDVQLSHYWTAAKWYLIVICFKHTLYWFVTGCVVQWYSRVKPRNYPLVHKQFVRPGSQLSGILDMGSIPGSCRVRSSDPSRCFLKKSTAPCKSPHLMFPFLFLFIEELMFDPHMSEFMNWMTKTFI